MKKTQKVGLVLALLVVLGATSYLVMYTYTHSRAAHEAARREAEVPGQVASGDVQSTPQTTGSESADSGRPRATDRSPAATESGKPAQPDRAARQRPGSAPGAAGAPRMHADNPAFRSKMALMRLVRGIGRLTDDEKTPITPAQAKAILGILNPLRTQATLTPAEADKVCAQLDAQLTAAQREAIAKLGPVRRERREGQERRGENGTTERWEGRRGEPGAADRRPGGAPGGPAGRPGGEGRPDRPAIDMEKVNPFYAGGDDPMAARMAERWKTVFTALEAKAGK